MAGQDRALRSPFPRLQPVEALLHSLQRVPQVSCTDRWVTGLEREKDGVVVRRVLRESRESVSVAGFWAARMRYSHECVKALLKKIQCLFSGLRCWWSLNLFRSTSTRADAGLAVALLLLRTVVSKLGLIQEKTYHSGPIA